MKVDYSYQVDMRNLGKLLSKLPYSCKAVSHNSGVTIHVPDNTSVMEIDHIMEALRNIQTFNEPPMYMSTQDIKAWVKSNVTNDEQLAAAFGKYIERSGLRFRKHDLQ